MEILNEKPTKIKSLKYYSLLHNLENVMMPLSLNALTCRRREKTFSEIGRKLAHYSPGENARFSNFELLFLNQYQSVENFEHSAGLV